MSTQTMEKKVTNREEIKIKNAATVGWFKEAVHKGKNEIHTEVKTVTPAMADILLSQNPSNRKVRPAKMAQMINDMKEDRWAFNGEPIIISKEGELNDGQHRLMALIQANKSLPMLFVFGVERDSRMTVDQGAPRGAHDYLEMEGMEYAMNIASVARMLIAFERAKKLNLGKATDISASQVLERIKSDPSIKTSVLFAFKHLKSIRHLTTSAVVAFCHNVMLNIDVNDGLDFMQSVCTGESIKRGDPAFMVRERLLRLDSRSRAVHVEILFRGWNAHRERRQLSVIPVRGNLPELI